MKKKDNWIFVKQFIKILIETNVVIWFKSITFLEKYLCCKKVGLCDDYFKVSIAGIPKIVSVPKCFAKEAQSRFHIHV